MTVRLILAAIAARRGVALSINRSALFREMSYATPPPRQDEEDEGRWIRHGCSPQMLLHFGGKNMTREKGDSRYFLITRPFKMKRSN